MKNGFPAPNKELAINRKTPLDRESPIQVRIRLFPAASHANHRFRGGQEKHRYVLRISVEPAYVSGWLFSALDTYVGDDALAAAPRLIPGERDKDFFEDCDLNHSAGRGPMSYSWLQEVPR